MNIKKNTLLAIALMSIQLQTVSATEAIKDMHHDDGIHHIVTQHVLNDKSKMTLSTAVDLMINFFKDKSHSLQGLLKTECHTIIEKLHKLRDNKSYGDWFKVVTDKSFWKLLPKSTQDHINSINQAALGMTLFKRLQS